MARSLNVYTSLTTVTAPYNFVRQERCLGDLMSPETIKRT